MSGEYGYILNYKEGSICHEKYFATREEMEEFIKSHPHIKIFETREKTRPIKHLFTDEKGRVRVWYTDVNGNPVTPDLITQLDDILVSKYGITYKELLDIVNSSSTQPEAIQKLRIKLTGSTKYNPTLYEIERLLSQLYDSVEHSYIPGVKDKFIKAARSFVIRNSAHTVTRKPDKIHPLPNPKTKIPSKPSKPQRTANRNTHTMTEKTHPLLIGSLAILLAYFLYKWLR